MKITKSDLNKAMATPWDSRTCLLRQAILRNGGGYSYYPPHDKRWQSSELAECLMLIFDTSPVTELDEPKPLPVIAKALAALGAKV